MSEERKKILYIITKSNFGGAQRYVFDVATHAADQHEVSVAFGGTGSLKDKLEEKDIDTREIQSFEKNISVWKDVRAFFEIASLIRELDPDVLHLSSSKAGGVGVIAGRLLGVPRIIFTSHGLTHDETWRPVWQRVLIKYFTWLTFVLSHKVILISTENKRVADKMLLVKEKTSLIHNATQSTPLLSQNDAKEYIIERHKNIPTNITWTGTISELTHNKGLTHMIHAVKNLKDQGADIAFLVFGGGKEKEALEKLINKLNLQKNVFLLGFVDNAQKYIRALDIFTLTSLKEGHPYALLEAANAALPVTASDIPGIRDIVEHKKTGLLVPPKNQKAIARALSLLIKNQELAAQYGNALKTSTDQTFSFKKMLHDTMLLY